MTREPVDVVIPFVGDEQQLREVIARMRVIALGDGDSLTLVDNTRAGASGEQVVDGVLVLSAPQRQSSYFARNAGAAHGVGSWIVFLDADVEPERDLVDSYFETAPREDAGILAGTVTDGPPFGPGGECGIAGRYAMLRRSMTQENTLAVGRWSYAQTANCAVRRAAFESVGGFRAEIRSGGDADLCFRLANSGWTLERRDRARVVHRSRVSLRRLLGQRARHGAGAAWLNRNYPGSFPPGHWPGLAVFTLKQIVKTIVALARGDRDQAVLAYVEPLSALAFELGRGLANDVENAPRRPVSRWLERLLLG